MKSFIGRLLGLSRESDTSASQSGDPVLEPRDDDPIEMLREHIRREVASGFYDEDVILTGAADYFDGDIDSALVRREAPRLLREALAEHAAQEATWTDPTDCDRLDAAFAALEADGVIARQHFSCCGNCGSTEIWDEIRAAEDAGLPARGYAFYHVQDTEAAVEGYGIYLGYGACAEGEAAALAVANDIVTQLNAHGLKTNWDGSWNRRIGVALDWKRRRAASAF